MFWEPFPAYFIFVADPSSHIFIFAFPFVLLGISYGIALSKSSYLLQFNQFQQLSLFQLSTHAPMMIRVPGLTDRGVVTEKLTEFVDLFPTLVEAAGLPTIPLCPEDNPYSVSLNLYFSCQTDRQHRKFSPTHLRLTQE